MNVATLWRWGTAGLEELTSSEIVDVFQVHNKSYDTLKDKHKVTNTVNTYTFDALVAINYSPKLECSVG